MYCPKCGRAMNMQNGKYICESGNMSLSAKLHEQFVRRYPTSNPRTSDVEIGFVMLRWFCPGCGTHLDKNLCCRACGECIKDVYYQLVELHPHHSECESQ